MKRALSVVYSLIILVFFLPGPAGANLMRNGGFEAGDPSADVAFLCGEDSTSASRYDDLFMPSSASQGTSISYFTPDRLVWGVSGSDLSYETLQYHAYLSVSGLWDNDPDARKGFQLLEAYGLFCDNTDTWAILETIPAEGVPAPVPEPATILLIGSGLVSVGLISRMRRKTKTG